MVPYYIEYKVYKSDITTLVGIIVSDYKNNVFFISKDDIKKYTYSNQKINSAGHLYSGKGSSHIHIDCITEKSFNKLKKSDWKDLKTLQNALSLEPKYGR